MATSDENGILHSSDKEKVEMWMSYKYMLNSTVVILYVPYMLTYKSPRKKMSSYLV